MKKIILSLLVGSFLFASCKKDDKCDFNASNLAGTYKVTSIKFKMNSSTPEIDLYPSLEACEKDDLLIFGSGGTFTYSDAGTQCTPPGDDGGTWSISGNNLIWEGETYSVPSFSCGAMTVSQVDNTTGESYSVTLSKQ